MILTPLDWLVIAAYFAVNLAIGFFYMKRASGNIGEFFLSGRNVSWWLAGTSMVATTFAADTPLVVTGLIYAQGIAGNWLWWRFLLSGMLTVFFFARTLATRRCPHRHGVGRAALRRQARRLPARIPRHLPRPSPSTASSWDGSIWPWPRSSPSPSASPPPASSSGPWSSACLALTPAYTAVSGLWGVLWTDLVQFVLKMSMVILLAYFAVHAVGGMGRSPPRPRLRRRALHRRRAPRHPGLHLILRVALLPACLHFPRLHRLNWWAIWYPGAEPGGGGYIAQRIFSAKNEKHSSAQPSGSTSPTTPSAPGRGFSPLSSRSSFSQPHPRPGRHEGATSGSWSTICRPACAA